MECNDDTGAMILLRIKRNIVFSYTLHHAGSGNGALRCTGGATGPGTWQGGQEVIVSSDLSERIDYNIPDLPIYARRDALSSFPDYRCPCHWHRDLEFIHVISGQMQYFVNGAIVTLEAGNGLVVNSSRLHYGFSPQQRQCRFTCGVVDQNCLSGSARMSGFSSASYFINVFRRRRGVTPRIWRESAAPIASLCVGRVTVRGGTHSDVTLAR